MPILSRYILKEFMRFFLYAFIGIVTVYLCVDFLQKADDFIKHRAGIMQVLRYFLYSLPEKAGYSIPFSALVAALLSLGSLSRHSEVIAMRASGLSLIKIVSPVFLGGLIVSAAGFINNEALLPHYSALANHIKKVEVEKKKQMAVFRQSRLWLRGPDNSIANIELISPEKNEMLGVNIYKLNPDYTVQERIKADRLVWKDGAWRLENSWKFMPSGNAVEYRSGDGEAYNIVDSPEDLSMIVKRSEEMNIAELFDYVKRLKTSGYNAVRYEVDLHGKLALPLAGLLMAMIATPFSISRTRSGGAGRAIAVAVLIAFVYWSFLTIGLAFGKSGVLPPLVAAWLANIVFAAATLYILTRLQKKG